jgi:hypothetical protein
VNLVVNQKQTVISDRDDEAQEALCKFRPFTIELAVFFNSCSTAQSQNWVGLKDRKAHGDQGGASQSPKHQFRDWQAG